MAKSRKLSDLSIKRGRPEAGEVKGGRTKFTLGTNATLKKASVKTATVRASARARSS